MLRKTIAAALCAASLSVVALAVPGAPAASAAPAPPPPFGNLFCTPTGTATFKPGLPVTRGTKDVRFAVKKATATCPSVYVEGGKAPITNATVTLTGVLPKANASCADWAQNSEVPTQVKNVKLTVKLTNVATVNGKLKTTTVATLRADVTRLYAYGINALGSSGMQVRGTIPQNAKGTAPFGGHDISFSWASYDPQAAQCAAVTGGMTQVSFLDNDYSSGLFINPPGGAG